MGRKSGSRKDHRKLLKLLERIRSQSTSSTSSCTTSSSEEEPDAAEATAALTGDPGQEGPLARSQLRRMTHDVLPEQEGPHETDAQVPLADKHDVQKAKRKAAKKAHKRAKKAQKKAEEEEHIYIYMDIYIYI